MDGSQSNVPSCEVKENTRKKRGEYFEMRKNKDQEQKRNNKNEC
jgi:hypothetical protein